MLGHVDEPELAMMLISNEEPTIQRSTRRANLCSEARRKL